MTESHETNGNTPKIEEAKNGQLPSDGKTEVDATEIDPCLELKEKDDEIKKKRDPFYEKYIESLQEKTGLLRKWVLTLLGLVILVFIFLVVIIGLAVGWPRVPHMFRYPICRNSECLRAASQIQENLNGSLSPCSNLWGAVCSKYTSVPYRPLDRAVWDQKQELMQKELERIRDIVSTFELPLKTATVEWKLKHFYEACLNVDSVSADAAWPLTNIISELGGWYILRDFNEVEFDGMEVLRKLQVRYGISPFFKIHVEANPHVPNNPSIRISPSGLGLPDRDYYYRDSDDRILDAYNEYIRDIVISLSLTKNDATKFGKDMFNYEKRLAEITPDLVTLQNPINTYNSIPLSDLKTTTGTIPFFDIIQEMYPDVNISENTDVIVTSLEYLTQVAQIISSTDRRTLNGYLIWTLVREYFPFLSTNFTSSVDSFNNELLGISRSRKRWEVCAHSLKKYMALATEYELERTYPISEKTRNIVNEIFKRILDVVTKKVAALQDALLLRQHLEAKLSELSLHIGLPDSTKTTHFLKDYYNSLKIMKLNLFEGMKSALFFEKKIEEKMLLNKLDEGVFLKEYLKEIPEVKYIPSMNAVVVPRSLVMEPFFENQYPRPVLYGRLGQEIAKAILSAVLPYGSLWTADKKILSPFHMSVNDSVRVVQPAINCLKKYMSKDSFEVSTTRVFDTSLALFQKLAAVKVAYKALISSATNDHEHFGGLEQYEENTLFFLTFAQTLCSSSTSQYQIHDNLLHFNLPASSVLDIAWNQIEDFRSAFECPSTPTEICPGIF